MSVEQQYIDLFSQTEAMICRHSAEALNAPRAAAFADFERLGFPTRKTEKYKYTDVSKFFEPDYGLNLNRLEIPVNPYEVFKCDVPNMSTSLYFVVNDAFYNKALPKSHLPEGVIFGSLKEMAEQRPELVKKYYGKLADTSKDGVTAFNTAFAQAGRIRTSKTEYISCPGCGRTLYDLESTIARIKQATSHLKGLKIGIMGCIVNGPGEMADADYGYVGAGRGKISLYKKKECIEKNIPEEEAVEKLIELIRKNGDYTER